MGRGRRSRRKETAFPFANTEPVTGPLPFGEPAFGPDPDDLEDDPDDGSGSEEPPDPSHEELRDFYCR